jgi:tetratricopeptide (TPR) repeat protein
LFELLTDTQPWLVGGGPIAQAVRVVLDKSAPVPSERAASVAGSPFPPRVLRGDFDAIVAKAVRKEPSHRYPTVEALATDIEHALRGEPVAARSGARLYVFRRTLWRYRWVTLAVAAVLVSLAVGLGAAAVQARRAQIERDAARREAAREDAVRYQLTHLFRTAIEERGTQPATAKTMIDSSALRVLREYRSQPELEGQIVLTLADLYGALEDAEGAAALLEGFVNQAGPDSDPAALADARQKLANIMLQQGHKERAAALIGQAEKFWNADPDRYAEERLEGLGIKARVQRTMGDLAAASATETEAIRQRIASSGRVHRETAVLYNSHAITLITANRLDEALAAYRETMAIYEALGLGDELDIQVIRGNMGLLEVRTGHLHEAETLLKSAYERERALGGDSAAVAAAMGLYGEVLSNTGRSSEALPIAQEALDVATKFAGPTSPVALQNRMFLADAQLGSGDTAAAQANLVADHAAALGQYGPRNLFTLLTATGLAHLTLVRGDAATAQAQLAPVIAQSRQLAAPGQPVLARCLQYLGESELTAGKPADAITPLQESAGILSRFAARGWQLAEVRERLGEALDATGQRALAVQPLRQAVEVLSAELGDQHPDTVRARNELAKATAK